MKNKKNKKKGLFLEKLSIGSFLSLFILGPILCVINREDIFIILFIAVIVLMMILSAFSKNTKSDSKEIAEYYNLKDLTHLSAFYKTNQSASNYKETYRFYEAKASNASSIEESIEKQIQTHDPLFYKTKFKHNAYTFFLIYNQSIIENNLQNIKVFSTDRFIKITEEKLLNNLSDPLFNIQQISDCIARYEILQDGYERITYQIIVKGNSPTRSYLDSNGIQTNHFYNTYRVIFIRQYGIKTTTTDDIISLNCPNCGAPIKDSSTKICKHCNGSVNAGNYTWKLDDIEYWKEGKQ